MSRGAPSLPPAALRQFLEAVEARLGLRFEGHRVREVERALRARLRLHGCRSIEAYLPRLAAADELEALVDVLTVGETSFFRNSDHFRALEEVVVPELAAEARGGELRVLSAGCATGEEAYSLALLLRDHPAAQHLTPRVWGVDVNPAALARARAARYSAWSLRQLDWERFGRYFSPAGRRCALRDDVRDGVLFMTRNLTEDDPVLWARASFDLILCRNVTMYFGESTFHRVIARLERALRPGGYLFLGHAETLRGSGAAFTPCRSHRTFYYRRGRALRGAAASAATPRPLAPLAPPDAPPSGPGAAPEWFVSIRASSQRIARLGGHPRDAAAEPADPPAAADPLAPARTALQGERYAEALERLDALPEELRQRPEAQLVRALAVSSSQPPAAAEPVLARLIQAAPLSAEAHYLLALHRERTGSADEAKASYLAAAYLDPDFALPRLRLGQLASARGDSVTARRELRAALELLPRAVPERLLLLGGGFGASALAGVCHGALRRLTTRGGGAA